ncbi:bis(5'-nucleosyl)-tetraphosphatase (symmetrical) YqeK [Lachnospiraceae bacterium NSJ-143]|nr:bis(5'-nucleosyl)-tetraphosphatase (symmetrical) YqeK [Lachnospiraceae bacterium NSJ-143]
MLSFTVSERKLQSSLSIERYIHTMGVVKAARGLSKRYGADMEKASYAALLHDCAKDYPNDMKLRFCREYHIPVDDIMALNTELIHQFLGAEVAKREYLVEDEDILNAIRFHTTGRPGMSLLEKIIFIADYIEEGRRKFDTLEVSRELAYENIDKAMAFILKNTIEYIKLKDRALHPLSVEAYEFYKCYMEE